MSECIDTLIAGKRKGEREMNREGRRAYFLIVSVHSTRLKGRKMSVERDVEKEERRRDEEERES